MNKKVIAFLSLVVSLVGQNSKSSTNSAFNSKSHDQEKQIILMQTDGEDRKFLLKALSISDVNDLNSEEKNRLMFILERVKNRLEVESTPYVMD